MVTDDREQLRSDNAVRLIEHGITLIREGSQQLRNLGLAVNNPLADISELGRPADLEAMAQKVKIQEHHDVHHGVRNSEKASRPHNRPKPRGVR